jgi:hypothetical protein
MLVQLEACATHEINAPVTPIAMCRAVLVVDLLLVRIRHIASFSLVFYAVGVIPPPATCCAEIGGIIPRNWKAKTAESSTCGFAPVQLCKPART